MKKIILVAVLLISAIAVSGCIGQTNACTQEAKLCPDGSYVGRIGPNCEFATCPGLTNENVTSGNQTGKVCIQVYQPVCGEDGNSYTNACFAGLAGVKIKYQGECNISIQSKGPNTVVIMDNYIFTPSVVSINIGESVTWVNRDTINHQVASDPYATNSYTPGLYSPVISPGGNYTFVFNTTGSHGYHDHLNQFMTGTVIVYG